MSFGDITNVTTGEYNVQGPKDSLTETQIFQSPLATKALGDNTDSASTARLVDPDRTRLYGQDRPFPDVRLPSPIEHQEFEKYHQQPDTRLDDESNDTSSDSQDDSASDDK